MRMIQQRPDISEFRKRIHEYYGTLAEQMNATSNRLSKIEAKLSAISQDIKVIKETANVNRDEFEDIISTMVESMNEVVVPSDPFHTQVERIKHQK